MSYGFWKNLHKPFFVLAPMANVTDAAFRRIIAKYGKPDVMFTEFVSCDGLCSNGKDKLLPDFWYTDAERPIVAQIFGSKPENFYKCAKIIKQLGFDGIDINMGCPDRSVEKQGAGAALMKNPKLTQTIIHATKEGAGDLPVSVKTRIGYNKNQITEWIPVLLETELAAITVHARTRKEMSLVPAQWETVREAVALRDRIGSRTRIIGNGDVASLFEARQCINETGADGVMIGRGIFGNPWLFNPAITDNDLPLKARFDVMLEHVETFVTLFSGIKNFAMMKKHFKAYVSGFPGASELRAQLMEEDSIKGIRVKIERFLYANPILF